MVDLPKVSRNLTIVKGPTSGLSASDIAAPHRMLAQSMDKVGDALMDVAEPLAEQAGYAAVRKGENGELVVDRGPLPIVGRAGKAFERAAKQTYLAQQAPQIETELTKIRLDNPMDPEAVRAGSEAFVNEMAAKAERNGGVALGAAIRNLGAREAGQNYRTALVTADRLNVQNAEISYKSRLSEIDNKGAALARQGGTDTDEYRALIADAGALYAELGADPRFKYSADRIKSETDEMAARHQGEAVVGRAMQMYDKGSAAEARKFLQEQAWNPAYNLSPAQRQQIVTRGVAALEGRTAENKALVDANKKLVSETIEALKTDAPYDSRQINDLIERTATLGDAESFYKLNSYKALHDWRQGIQGLPLGQQLAARRHLQGDDTALTARESGNDPAKVNPFGYSGLYQFGAPRLATLGLYQPGAGENLDTWSRTGKDAAGKWSGTFNIPGHPEVRTLDDFLRSEAAQRTVRALDIQRMDADSAAAGLDRYIGQTVGGVPITREGIRNMMHLGGLGGARQFLESGGRVNIADANGTTVGDYARMGAARSSAASVTAEGIRVEAVNDFTKRLGPVLEGAISTLETALTKGRQPTAQEISDIAEGIAITGRKDLTPRVETALRGAVIAARADGLPASARDAFRARLQSEAQTADPATRKVIDMAVETINATEKAMRERPYSTAAARRGYNPPMPFDYGNPQAVAAAVGQRNAMDRINREFDGTPARSIFEGQEGEAWKQAMASGGAETVAGALRAVSELDSDQLQATMADNSFAKGVVTASVSPNPAKMNAGMSFLDRAWRANPTKFNADFGPDAAKRLQAWQWMKDSYGPAEIAERMQKLDDPANAAARKSLADAGKTEARKITLADVVMGFKTGWVPFTGPGAPVNVTARGIDGFAQERLLAEFNEYYGQARSTGLPADEARKAATERLKVAWGPSVANGGALMRHPPEKYYAMVDGGHDWIKRQIDDFLIAANPDAGNTRALSRMEQAALRGAPVIAKEDRGLTFKALVADAQTEGEIANGVKPSYQIVAVNNATGKMELVKAPDGKSRFRFDDSGPKAATEQRILDFNAGVAAMFPPVSDGPL